MPPNPSPDAAPRHRPATYARAGAALARPAHYGSAAQKSSSPSPRLPGSDRQAPPASPRLDRRTTETYGAGHPHKLSPSIHSSQSLAKTSLHYFRKCSRTFLMTEEAKHKSPLIRGSRMEMMKISVAIDHLTHEQCEQALRSEEHTSELQ